MIDDEYFDWSNLPEDLKVGILCGLGDDDDKALMRLKSVSRSWYFFISNLCAPRISCNTLSGLFFTDKDAYTYDDAKLVYRGQLSSLRVIRKQHQTMAGFIDSLLPFKHSPYDLHDCCNGLLLFARFPKFCLLNPTTYEYMLIPDNPQTTFNANRAALLYRCASALAFDPINHHPSNSFLIVVTKARSCVSSNSSLDLDVFSSNSGNWASHTVPLDPPILNGFRLVDRSIYLNGNLYMLSMDNKYLLTIHHLNQYNNNYNDMNRKKNIMNYARATELPAKDHDEFPHPGTFGVLQRTLAYSNSDHSQILVWVLLQDGLHWALQHRISLDELLLHAHPLLLRRNYRGQIKVYAFHPNLQQIFVGTPDWMQKYNPRTKKLQLIEHVMSYRSILCGEHKVFPYSPCPIILKRKINNNNQ